MNFILETPQEISFEHMLIRIIISMIFGVCIGLERELNRQPAGLRTHALICIGSTLIMLVSIWIPQFYHYNDEIDPTRIAAQVVSGIGFVGAGAIIKLGTNIRGITTASSIWSCGAIGLAVGVGLFKIAAVTTFIVLLVLITFSIIESKVFSYGSLKRIIVTSHELEVHNKHLEEILKKNKIKIRSLDIEVQYTPKTVIKHSFLVNFERKVNIHSLHKDLKKLNMNISKVSIKEI
ncbi:MgtC/SapB family protein [Halosquirtibacter laminarini]|uniref:MgtC/SapB family protein n=1 Tax=Halosquirtibacter laminarini TaxID=3374600 RepID=A0AC61ND49_9BACT|nr:MgtC/SapB family protein [Prolixibacteraceae bacterium]